MHRPCTARVPPTYRTQAGILQGEVSNMMVLDQWQASLMRALAKLQLRSDPRVKAKVEQVRACVGVRVRGWGCPHTRVCACAVGCCGWGGLVLGICTPYALHTST